MDNLDDSENNAKISDSAYSNSCSNSQSRRSGSSKSTHSGSHSSGSSGYGGKPSTGSSNALSQQSKNDKDSKKKKQTQVETLKADAEIDVECITPDPVPAITVPLEIENDVVLAPSQIHTQKEKEPENIAATVTNLTISKDEVRFENTVSTIVTTNSSPMLTATINFVTSRPSSSYYTDGFSCIISMQDGVVMYTTPSLVTTLGFPKDMWIGRSFIDFLHPRDRNTFASQITNGLAIPKVVNDTLNKAAIPDKAESTMVCRIRRYKGLSSGFGVKDNVITFMPFLLKFTFKNVCDDGGDVTYLVLQATTFISAFKIPHEVVTKASPFVIRHAANGNLEYIDLESVPYLGYLPQDVTDKDALQLYHPEDLGYLRQVYETIVKEGGLQRSNPYRMVAQNGHFIKVETEWSSFINPWSRKLEFVTAKHHIIEGPANPDVFQTPDPEIVTKLSELEKIKAQMLRESIIRVMNEALTKPAEMAKQQMSKRCQDLTSFMESLLDDSPKTDDELRLEIQDAEQSYYERDSVMLGGISPHHEHNDSKSSTDTPLNYNQLNYNETLQRYFDSHQPFTVEDNDISGGVIIEPKPSTSNNILSTQQNYGNTGELTSSFAANALVNGNNPFLHTGHYQPVKLTDSLLNKHNSDMEKEFLKTYRGNKFSTRGERDKDKHETRQKKKEHLARCNASFQPTSAGPLGTDFKPHGVKRPSKEPDAVAHKYHCTSPRQLHRQSNHASGPIQSTSNMATTLASTQWSPNPMNNMNTFFLGVGIPQQVPVMGALPPMGALPALPGAMPMFYTPATMPVPAITQVNTANTTIANPPQYQAPMPCMMYGQPIYGSPFMYPSMMPHVSYPMQQPLMTQNMQFANMLNPLYLSNRHYEGARTSGINVTLPEKKRIYLKSTKCVQENADNKCCHRESATHRSANGNRESAVVSSNVKSPWNGLGHKNTEPMPGTSVPRDMNKINKQVNNEENVDRTDEESSYSSFYSSFFKTESGSVDDSSDAKRTNAKDKCRSKGSFEDLIGSRQTKQVTKRKMDPPWLEQVCVTSEFIYKYQMVSKPLEEVLKADKTRMNNFEQSALVNEQLSQLYLDLQLEGVAARLTLEEGITSSSSSGEETTTTSKSGRKKRDYNKYGIIYEENAPMPPKPDHQVSSSSVP